MPSNAVIQRVNDVFTFNDPSKIPNILAPEIQLCAEVNPLAYPLNNVVRSAAGGTIYTTPTDKDFYLTQIQISGTITNSTNNNVLATESITAYVGGVNSTVGAINASISGSTVAPPEDQATSGNAYIIFNYPIKIDRNTAIAVSGGFGSVTAVIIGFTYNNTVYNQ